MMKISNRMLFWAFVCVTATACGRQNAGDPVSYGTLPQAVSEANALATDGAASRPTMENVMAAMAAPGPAAWSAKPNTAAWTTAVAAVVTANLASFERARDREVFCPGYAKASLAQRKTCWVRLVSAVSKFESDFDPTNAYREASGNYSVGLLQLSPNECPNAPSVAALKNPIQNLICGTRRMASLIARYGYVTTPDNTHGAAAYWSTLRAPYTHGGLRLGKRNQVAAITGAYQLVSPVVQ